MKKTDHDLMSDSCRIDKWLWAVRICKTRKIAAELCEKHRVTIDGQVVKPSRDVKTDQIICIKRDGIEYQYKVIAPLDKRVSAPLSLQYKEDITPHEELEKLKVIKTDLMPQRPKGAGRPTKKERRTLEKLTDFEN